MIIELFHYFTALLVQLGYWGVFIGMFLQSTFIPFPSEIVMLPAGAAIHNGEMSFSLVTLAAVLGNVLGASFNYIIAWKLGRNLVLKYGKYVGFQDDKLLIVEGFFRKYGSWSMLLGRLVPMVRQFISLPAGLARMNFFVFAIFTAVGSFIWIFISINIGYLLANYPELLSRYLLITAGGAILLMLVVYKILRYRYVLKNK